MKGSDPGGTDGNEYWLSFFVNIVLAFISVSLFSLESVTFFLSIHLTFLFYWQSFLVSWSIQYFTYVSTFIYSLSIGPFLFPAHETNKRIQMKMCPHLSLKKGRDHPVISCIQSSLKGFPYLRDAKKVAKT